MQQCKLIIFSNFYCILSCCLNLFFMSNMLFCMYILFTMDICILLCIHVTVLYYILASFQKNKMLMLMMLILKRLISAVSEAIVQLVCSRVLRNKSIIWFFFNALSVSSVYIPAITSTRLLQ